MAARKPKNVSAWLGGNRGTVQSGGGRPTGIVDDIAKGIKDIASPWLPAAPGQNKSVTQAQGLARATAETLDQTVTGGLVKAGTQGNKALAKQAAINAAALGTGYVAGKAIQTAAGAAAKTGVPQRLLNTLTNKTVVLHGTGEILTDVRGIPYKFDSVGKPVNRNASLRPRTGSAANPNESLVYGWNPKNLDGRGHIEEQLQIYANQERSFGYKPDTIGFKPQNQIVVGTAPKKNVRFQEIDPGSPNDAIYEVSGPVKIKQVVKGSTPTENTQAYYDRLERAVRRAGAKTAVIKSGSKKEAAKLAKRKRITDENSSV
jgi:hypothetical protein